MKKVLVYTLSVIALLLAIIAFKAWSVLLRPNVKPGAEERITVRSSQSYGDFINTLTGKDILLRPGDFRLVARLMSLDRSLKPGSYIFSPGMNNYRMVNIIRTGRQTPVKVTFNNIRTLNELAGRIGGQIEADSASISAFLADESNYSEDGFNRANVISVFLPDTYQLYWNTDAEKFYRRMLKEYNNFWTAERRSAAEKEGLTPVEASIIASIVDDEVLKADEKPRIAGVYLNRLRIGMPLQACPTIKFALNDFTIRRVLYEHLQTESPYNTYKYKGLPPGPVRCPSKEGLEAVIHAEKHDYLYFAARADFSGYHHFSRTLAEHNRYANAYQRELDRRGIYE